MLREGGRLRKNKCRTLSWKSNVAMQEGFVNKRDHKCNEEDAKDELCCAVVFLSFDSLANVDEKEGEHDRIMRPCEFIVVNDGPEVLPEMACGNPAIKEVKRLDIQRFPKRVKGRGEPA